MASELESMSTDVKNWYSASKLARLGAAKVIDMPGTERNARDKARRLSWPARNVEGGGGAGGMRTEYQPPADVLAQIHAFLAANPDFFGKEKRRGIAPQEGDVKRTPFPAPGTTIKAKRLMPGAQWMARIAMYAGEAEWLQQLDIDRKLGLVMEAFNMILILSGGNDELLARIMGNKDAMLSALRLAYEIDRVKRKDTPPA